MPNDAPSDFFSCAILFKRGKCVFFVFLSAILIGIAFLRTHSTDISQKLFQLPETSHYLQTASFYHEEVIDPKENYPMAHVASITELPNGSLAAAWYAGSGEVQPDVKIYFATKKPGEIFWSSPQVIITREKATQELHRYIKALGNALLFSGSDGVLQLLYVTISMGKWSGSMLNVTSSKDGGLSWKKSKRLFLSPFLNLSELVKNTPLSLVNGGWAIPIYQEFLGKFPEVLWLLPSSTESWKVSKSRIAGGCSFFQPSLTALSSQRAIAFCRDYLTSGKIWKTETQNHAKQWSRPETLSLPNHDSGVASLRLSNGWLLLAFNNSTIGRDTLCLALSQNEGKTWSSIATIAKEAHGDFSYPYFFQSRDGIIHLLYSWKRCHIHHVSFNETWVNEVAKEKTSIIKK